MITKELLQKLSGYLLPVSVLVNALLLYTVNKLPEDIMQALNPTTKDTCVVTKTETVRLQNKGNFIYFEGEVVEGSRRFLDLFSYDPKFPEDIFAGYLTVIKSTKGGEFYLWSKNEIVKTITEQKIGGWFVTDGLAVMQREDKYIQILYPIVRKETTDPVIVIK